MADRIFTSSDAETVLTDLRVNTKLEYAVIARLALCYSLSKCGREVPQSREGAGKEIRLVSLLSDDATMIRTVIAFVYGRVIEEEEFAAGVSPSIIKDHVDHGLRLIGEFLTDSNHNTIEMLTRLVEEISEPAGRVSMSTFDLDVSLGRIKDADPVIVEFNDTERHANSHMAIMGKPGVGKTQFLLKLLADLREQSSFQLNFIFFDYKGDVSDNARFVECSRASVIRVPQEQLPINPFILNEYSPQDVLISAREKAESFGSINPNFGVVQKGALQECIRIAYEQRKASPFQYPDFNELFEVVRQKYADDNRREDSLFEIVRDLSSFRLFWEHGSEVIPIDRVSQHTMIVDLHQLPVLKELVVYLTIERLYKEMMSLPDSQVVGSRREIRTILVIDEAHNYLRQRNPFLERIIREGRSKGVVVFFASQSPDDFVQKNFDFKELLEFLFLFQCEGVSPSGLQELLGCSAKIAKELQVELPRLRPFEIVTKSLNEDEKYCRFRGDAFFRAYS